MFLFCFLSLGLGRSILFGLKEHNAACSNWLMLYFIDIVSHWLVMIGIATKIVMKNGRALYRLYLAPRMPEQQELEMNVLRVSTITVENYGSLNHVPSVGFMSGPVIQAIERTDFEDGLRIRNQSEANW